MLKKENLANVVKALIGLALGGLGGLLLLTNSSYVAAGTNPALQIFGACTGLVLLVVAPVLIIPAPHDE